MLAILTNVYSKLRGLPQDWYITGAIFVGALLLIALSIILARRKSVRLTAFGESHSLALPNPNQGRNLEEEIDLLKSQLAQLSKHELSFEIDGSQTQVHVSGGVAVRRIELSVRLRCFKAHAGAMAIREFQASLHTEGSQGEQVIIERVNAARAWYLPGTASIRRGIRTHSDFTLDIDEGLVVNDPISPYYWFFFYLDLPPHTAAGLSSQYFLRITMNAVGQEPQSLDFYVDSWNDVRQGGFSYVTLRNNPIATADGDGATNLCGDKWLHDIAQYETKAAQVRLVVTRCGIWNRRFSEDPREIEFSFDLINCAVYPLTLGEILSSARIVFAQKPLLILQPCRKAQTPIYTEVLVGFTLLSNLQRASIFEFKNANQQCAFKFQRLSIEIKGGKGYEDVVAATTLRIPFMVTLTNEIVPARNRPAQS